MTYRLPCLTLKHDIFFPEAEDFQDLVLKLRGLRQNGLPAGHFLAALFGEDIDHFSDPIKF